jgi:hypothetical protein
LEAEGAVTGNLRRLTWVLGTHVDESEVDLHWANVYTASSKRSMAFINPAATLATGKVVMRKDRQILLSPAQNDIYKELAKQVGTIGILDRVGSQHYTPWSFAKEVWDYGPSRKVSKKFMEMLAPHLPMPVLFCHGTMPIYGKGSSLSALDAAESLLNIEGDYRYAPTWTDQSWGMTLYHENNGDNHYLLPILCALAQDIDLNSADLTDQDKERITGARMSLIPAEKTETVFIGSWFTKGTYVKTGARDKGIQLENVKNVLLEREEVSVV